MMKTRPQMTSVEETMRMPDWRSASPKNLSTRRRSTSPTTFEVNLTISPNDSIQPRGAARTPFMPALQSFACSLDDCGDLGVGGQQRLREGVVEGEDAQEGDHDRLVDGAPQPLGPA